MMRRSEFIRLVRQQSSCLPRDALNKVLLLFAEHVSNNAFSELLASFDTPVTAMPISSDLLIPAVKSLNEAVLRGEYALTWSEEDYFDGFSRDKVYTLNDPDGLGSELEVLLEAVIACTDAGEYETAFKAFEELFAITISSDDGDVIGMETLSDQNLVNMDFIEVVKHYAYASLMVLKPREGAAKLMEILPLDYKICLHEIEEVGDEGIPGKADFIREWSTILMEQPGWLTETALIDAAIYGGGIEALHAFTMEHGSVYKSSYIELIKAYTSLNQTDQAIEVALRGLDELIIDSEYRTQVADLLLALAEEKEDHELAAQAIWQGLRSAMDINHFMLLHQLQDEALLSQAMNYLEDNRRKEYRDYLSIRLLNGDHQLVWEELSRDTGSLGWSTSDKGRVFPMFIAILAGDGQRMTCVKEIVAEAYPDKDPSVLIKQVVQANSRFLTAGEYQSYYNWCHMEVDERVEAIVRGQHRGSYDKAAALAVAIAETMQSKGDTAVAVAYLRGVKAKYPRYSSFLTSLRVKSKRSGFDIAL